MKYYLILCLVLLPGVLRSEVFKCEAADGSVSYQQQECGVTAGQSTVEIEKIDPDRVQQAQQKLNQELQERAQLEARQAEQERKNKELQIKAQRAQYEQQMINETKLQTQAIQENTEALENQQYSDRVYYTQPYKPGVIQPITKPVAKPLPAVKSNSSGISINLKK